MDSAGGPDGPGWAELDSPNTPRGFPEIAAAPALEAESKLSCVEKDGRGVASGDRVGNARLDDTGLGGAGKMDDST